jgi:hypothetical protein
MLTYTEAKERHAVISEAELALDKKQAKDIAEPTWRALVDVDYEPESDSFGEALVLSMPLDAIPLVRSRTGISAVFLLSKTAEIFVKDRDFGPQAKAIWKAFEERARLANNVEEGYGCDKSAAWDLAREIAQMPDAKKVEEIAKMAGRMHKVLSGARKVPTDDPHEVKDIELGGDIERLTASELTQLSTPGLSDLAAIRLLEKRSQQYRMKGRTAASRGPLVICLDESGSMHDDGYANRNSWAKAASLALARVAHEGNRMVKVVHYSSVTDCSRCAPGDSRALLDMTRHFLSGGTDIAKALVVAAREVGDLAKEGFIGADVILVTDGEDYSSAAQDKVLGLMQAQGIRLWTVAIECDIAAESPLRKRAHELIRVGATDRADMIAGLRGAAENHVSDEEKKAAEERQRLAMN